MARTVWTPLLALGAGLVMADFAPAAEPASGKSANPALGFTMTLGGKGTAAEAATAPEDTEEACCRRRYYGCWGGYRGGWGGYSSYYGGGWGYGGGYGYGNYYSYAPVVSHYSAYSYRPYYLRPWRGYGYSSYYSSVGYGGFGGGYYVGINGTKDDADAPLMSLALATAKNPIVAAPKRTAETAEPGTFRYDGGPANPVPQVRPDAEPRTLTAPAAVGLPVSLKKETRPASPYRYKAYGEK
jgi:hypothetical protein